MFRYAGYAVLKRLRVLFTYAVPLGLSQKAGGSASGKVLDQGSGTSLFGEGILATYSQDAVEPR